MEERDVRALLSTALGTEPPSRFDTVGIVVRGRRARSRRRLAASGGTLVAVAALTLPLIATASPSGTPTAAPRSPSPTASPVPSATPTPSPSATPRPTASPSGPPPGRVVLTAGCATADPAAAAPEEHGLPGNQNKLMDVWDRLNPVANRQFGAVYAGAVLASPRDRLMVYRKPSNAFDRWVRREFARDCVEVRDAAYSAREIRARSDEILADRAYWQRRNINPAHFELDDTGQALTVGVIGDLERARAEFPARYRRGVPIVIIEAPDISFLREDAWATGSPQPG
ncbi:hypothetical protein ACGFI9_36635 [Micromonospora sp. NPDC048930]|uniref:hypothetical protein n=1 Tax=Micromonospora sp. NPDC048930 TaxID=3364261 RepID=UPI0037194B29